MVWQTLQRITITVLWKLLLCLNGNTNTTEPFHKSATMYTSISVKRVQLNVIAKSLRHTPPILNIKVSKPKQLKTPAREKPQGICEVSSVIISVKKNKNATWRWQWALPVTANDALLTCWLDFLLECNLWQVRKYGHVVWMNWLSAK